MRRGYGAALLAFSLCTSLYGESFRTILAGTLEVSANRPEGQSLVLSYVDSAAVTLGAGSRFMRGIELELKVPQAYLKYRGSLAVAVYSGLTEVPKPGVADLRAERSGFELLPNKLQAVYQIPLRANHGLRPSPYVSIPTGILQPSVFPILVRIMPVIKGLSDEIETLSFQLTAKPILADEGGLRLSFRYPEQLRDKPLTVRINDELVSDPTRERVLKEGEHRLTVVSDDYRNESRRFVIERGRVLDLTVDLQDPTPMISFEVPANTEVYFNGRLVANHREDFPAEPGEHELRFAVGDYSVVKPITIRKGKTYRIALTIDVRVDERD